MLDFPNETKASFTSPKDERTMTHWGFEIVRIDSVLVKIERGYVTSVHLERLMRRQKGSPGLSFEI